MTEEPESLTLYEPMCEAIRTIDPGANATALVALWITPEEPDLGFLVCAKPGSADGKHLARRLREVANRLERL